MTVWRTVDFRPAPAGWRAVYVMNNVGTVSFEPIAGWLVQDEIDASGNPNPDARRFVAAIHYPDGAHLIPATEKTEVAFWAVAGPDEVEDAWADDGMVAETIWAEWEERNDRQ